MKKIIIITSILIFFVTFSFLMVNKSQAWTDAECTTYCAHITDATAQANCKAECLYGNIVSKDQITALIVKITNWFAGIVFAIAVIMIIYGGVLYMTAAGSEEKAKTARKLLMYALIGIAVAILAFGAQALISSFMGMGGTE